MADIDSLEIEISAESTDAAQKVNALAQALERLKGALQGNGFKSISKRIQGIGDGAANTQVAKKQQAIRNIEAKVQGATTSRSQTISAREISSMEKQLKSLGAEFDAALDKAEQLRSQLDIGRQMRPISEIEKAQ